MFRSPEGEERDAADREEEEGGEARRRSRMMMSPRRVKRARHRPAGSGLRTPLRSPSACRCSSPSPERQWQQRRRAEKRSTTPTDPPPPPKRSAASAAAGAAAPESEYLNVKLSELHDVFQRHPDLEQKYLKIMKLPITGKESIRLPFDFKSHRQHTCLDLSPYGNDQVSRSACTTCKETTRLPTASDSMVAFINQTSNVMKHRKFYFGFRKNMELLKMAANQPQLFQIYYIVQSCVQEIVPLIYYDREMAHMQLIFEKETVHIPSQCIEQILTVAKDAYGVSLDIAHQRITLTARCLRLESSSLRIDVLMLQRKVDELEIPNETNEKFESYSL
ncbi:hypothetical protein MuHV1_gp058 [Murid betaherpesvirus 1]|uniref:M53 n=2 Tax=Murid herpesvirus 1 TaxID=10366 RepID=B3UX09_MUHV1|nr:hypothetical protein MuHV1_gp058 [Murid betaherpesvirus 1]ACE95240.1 M53 [Muromegalovirus G4]AQQ81337.1 M53 protein [Murid betaherpesvirus 1]AWV68485.1 M53 protein [Murid betaherpesvirus 1]AWV68661.1 M53 protein [Murid betaherpesvirus 1]QNL29204.1 M53 [Muromegalovirus G4]